MWSSRVAILSGVFLIWHLAAAAPAMSDSEEKLAELTSWLTGEDPLLILFVADGLRAEGHARQAPDGSAVMPRLARLAEESLVFENCLAVSTHPAMSLASLLDGAVPWERSGGGLDSLRARGFHILASPAALARMDGWGLSRFVGAREASLEQAMRLSGPTLWIELAPLPLSSDQLDEDTLLRLDPRPWGGGRPQTAEQRRSQRARLARELVSTPDMASAGFADRSWTVDAAHAQLDQQLGTLLDSIDALDISDRIGLVVTSLRGCARGDRGSFGIGAGLGLGSASVPLMLSWPSSTPQVVDTAVATVDLLSILEGDLTDRERWTLGFSVAASAGGGLRLTTDRIAFLMDPEPRLFDRDSDPGEFIDLAAAEPELVEALTVDARETWLGQLPELWVYVKGSEDVDLLTVEISANHPLAEAEPWNLEPVDGLDVPSANRISLSVAAEAQGDGFRLPLSLDFGETELRARRFDGSIGPVPRLGRFAIEATGGISLVPMGGTYLACVVEAESTPESFEDWVAEKDAGLYVWIVPKRK